MNKITVIGAGHVGSSVCFSLLEQNIADEIALIDLNENLVKGQVKDLKDCAFITYEDKMVKIGTYDDVRDSSFVVITAGLSQPLSAKEGRTAGLSKCVSIIKSIMAEITKRDYKGFIIVASNPLDVMTYYAYKLSGLDKRQVIGTGTLLDSTRLRIILADKLEVRVEDVEAMSLGEHGNTQFMLLSKARIKGVSLSEYLSREDIDAKQFEATVNNDLRRYGFEILNEKGSTYYGVAGAVSKIIKTIVNDEKKILPVSVYLNNKYGITDTYISVPAVLGKDGAEKIDEITMTDEEKKQLQDSALFIKSNIL